MSEQPKDDYSDFSVSLESSGPFSKRFIDDCIFANGGGTITINIGPNQPGESGELEFTTISSVLARALAARLIEAADYLDSRGERERPTCARCGGPNRGLISPGRKHGFWGCPNCDAHATSMDGNPPGKGAIPNSETELWFGAEVEALQKQRLADKADVA